MAGRKRTPSHLKMVKGNPGKRAVSDKEPSPPPGIPPAPAHLSAHARTVWPQVAKMLGDMGVLTKADGFALERLCEAYADWRMARESLQKSITYKTRDNKSRTFAKGGKLHYLTWGENGPMLRARPELAQIAAADKRLIDALRDFGLTPESRSKVPLAEGDSDDDAFGLD